MNPKKAHAQILKTALSYPGAHEDHPWGETVVKVQKKVFVFLGMPGPRLGLSVKLPDSCAMALTLPFAKPTGYGLGKAGWVSVELGPKEPAPLPLLLEWLDESYRAVAPKKLVATLDGGPAARPPRAPRRRKRG